MVGVHVYMSLMARRRGGRSTHRNTDGRKCLERVLQGMTQRALADLVGVKQQQVSAWQRGLQRPEPHHREALARVVGIPVEAWYSPEELRVARGEAKADDPPPPASIPPPRAA